MSGPLPDEIKRAEYLANVLARSVATATRMELARVSMPLEDAKELAQLLHDSLRSIKEGVEFEYSFSPGEQSRLPFS